MQEIVFVPTGVCSSKIKIQAENGLIQNVEFVGGCNGNLKAISSLIQGQSVDQVIAKLQGIRCGRRSTSCADQLTKALSRIQSEE